MQTSLRCSFLYSICLIFILLSNFDPTSTWTGRNLTTSSSIVDYYNKEFDLRMMYRCYPAVLFTCVIRNELWRRVETGILVQESLPSIPGRDLIEIKRTPNMFSFWRWTFQALSVYSHSHSFLCLFLDSDVTDSLKMIQFDSYESSYALRPSSNKVWFLFGSSRSIPDDALARSRQWFCVIIGQFSGTMYISSGRNDS